MAIFLNSSLSMTWGKFAVAPVAIGHCCGQLVGGVVGGVVAVGALSSLCCIKEFDCVFANIGQGWSVWVRYERGSFPKTCLSLKNSLQQKINIKNAKLIVAPLMMIDPEFASNLFCLKLIIVLNNKHSVTITIIIQNLINCP